MNNKFDLAYLQLLNTNRELREELDREVDINRENEKKIHVLIKEVEECYNTISFQDDTIISHESEIQELKSQVFDLEKRLRIALKDVEWKEAFLSNRELQISDLENEVERLKLRIQELISQYRKKINKDDDIDFQVKY